MPIARLDAKYLFVSDVSRGGLEAVKRAAWKRLPPFTDPQAIQWHHVPKNIKELSQQNASAPNGCKADLGTNEQGISSSEEDLKLQP